MEKYATFKPDELQVIYRALKDYEKNNTTDPRRTTAQMLAWELEKEMIK